VLSACQTGIGEIRSREGVFGLRRASHVAGVRTVVMSLWAVDDEATRACMSALYEARFKKQLTTDGAIADAHLMILRDRRRHGDSTHSFFGPRSSRRAAGDNRCGTRAPALRSSGARPDP
jgi:CHAT domain-containing protein